MNTIVKKNTKIERLIYKIRGKQVMLDSDLAKLYGCKGGTKVINQAVNRNIKRFPEDFYFQLSKNEFDNLKSQIVTSNTNNNYGGIRKLPYVFTEQGVAMLASVLRTEVASEVSIRIMRAFVLMKKYISSNLLEQKYINNLVLEHEERLKIVESTFSNFKEKNNHLFYKGQVYDAYSLLLDILNKSKSEIIIIDNYIDKNLLDILSKTNKKITIITNKYNNDDYDKYKKQYDNVKVIIDNSFHDRFIIIDKKELYHCGASFKDLGKRCFEISKINEHEVLIKLLELLSQKNKVSS
ncbi:MAG: ORF6N domain-containing protein [Bacilli bacterium]|nr:ORF6N domain-containing protein [Bacilli bacterium]